LASIQCRHSRGCACGKPWSTAAALKTNGCDCQPILYVATKINGRLRYDRAGKDMREAERALRKVAVKVDEGTYIAPRRVTFNQWSDEWLAALQRKETTRRSYASTLKLAKASFGHRQLRDVSPDDVRKMLRSMPESMSASTKAKHLRVVGACLGAAMQSGYTGQNAARMISRGERPRTVHKESAYFEHAELSKVFGQVSADTVFGCLFRSALSTGCRLGELLALQWGDVDLSAGELRVRRSITDGYLGTPKNHQSRSVDLDEATVELLGAWWGELGRPEDSTLVFPGATVSGYLTPKMAAGELYRAMKAAGVLREGSSGAKRSFHSFRHSHAAMALGAGASISWLQRRLGHQSITITVDRYGHFEAATRKAEAAKLEDVFRL
jgi:integrase